MKGLLFYAEELVLRDGNSVELTVPYQIPELSEPSFSLSENLVPQGYALSGGFSLNAEDVIDMERAFFSPNGERVEAILFTGPFEQTFKVHASPTTYTSLQTWFDEQVQDLKRFPVLNINQIGNLEVGLSYGVTPSFIFIKDGTWFHLTGRASLNEFLTMADQLSRPSSFD